MNPSNISDSSLRTEFYRAESNVSECITEIRTCREIQEGPERKRSSRAGQRVRQRVGRIAEGARLHRGAPQCHGSGWGTSSSRLLLQRQVEMFELDLFFGKIS